MPSVFLLNMISNISIKYEVFKLLLFFFVFFLNMRNKIVSCQKCWNHALIVVFTHIGVYILSGKSLIVVIIRFILYYLNGSHM